MSRGWPAAFAAVVLLGFWGARAASAGDDATVTVQLPHGPKRVKPIELYFIQQRCFQLLYKMRFAGEPLYAPQTRDDWERMIQKPAFRACIERALEAKELGY